MEKGDGKTDAWAILLEVHLFLRDQYTEDQRMSPPLVFVHIPKTAGTTFEAILDDQHGKERAFRVDPMDPIGSLEHFKSLSAQERGSYALIKGHATLELLPYLPSHACFITFIRDPVDQFISMFNHQKQKPYNRFHQEIQKIHRIDDLIAFRERKGIDNLQTRHLGDGLHHIREDVPFIDLKNEGDHVLQKALYRLNQVIDPVLLTEEFDMSLILLEKALRWSHRPYYSRKNISKKNLRKRDLDERTLEKIRAHSSFDIKVHQEAKKLFDSKKERFLGPDPEEKVKAFRKENSKGGVLSELRKRFIRLTGNK